MSDKIPWPKSEQELIDLLREALEPGPDPLANTDGLTLEQMAALSQTQESKDAYSAAADKLWVAAALAFNYASHVVGATGFQASWAALQFVREVNSIDGPFMLVRVENMLYPQYDVPRKVEDFLNDASTIEWLQEQAKKKLADLRGRLDEGSLEEDSIAPTVLAHWKALAGEE